MDANRRLAELLGWTAIFDVGGVLLGTPPPGAPACRNQAKVPDWTGDWRDCGPLMVVHVRTLDMSGSWLTVKAPNGFDVNWCREQGETDDQTTRTAIVNAVIMKLLEGRA